ncbi:MAG: T9SS type A sorting domain-containing protein [Bacteroidota bacterium]
MKKTRLFILILAASSFSINTQISLQWVKQLQAGKHSLDITHQATGVYFVRVKTENTQQQVKIIKE